MKGKLTLPEFFAKYPIPIKYVADKLGIARSTLSKKVKGTTPITDAEILNINIIVRELGKELFWIDIN